VVISADGNNAAVAEDDKLGDERNPELKLGEDVRHEDTKTAENRNQKNQKKWWK